MNKYSNLTELGTHFKVSSHTVGKWLKAAGLRDQDGRPSQLAFNENYVSTRPSRGNDTYYYVWDVAKTKRHLESMGYPKPGFVVETIGDTVIRRCGNVIVIT